LFIGALRWLENSQKRDIRSAIAGLSVSIFSLQEKDFHFNP